MNTNNDTPEWQEVLSEHKEKRSNALAWWKFLAPCKKEEFAKGRDTNSLTGREIQKICEEKRDKVCGTCCGSGEDYKYGSTFECGWCNGTGDRNCD